MKTHTPAMALLAGALLAATLGAVACSRAPEPNPATILGSYSTDPQREGPEIRVTAGGPGRWYMAVRKGGSWTSPVRLHVCRDRDLEAALGPDWSLAQPQGLCTEIEGNGIFQVSPGTVVEGVTMDSGWMARLPSGVREIHKEGQLGY